MSSDDSENKPENIFTESEQRKSEGFVLISCFLQSIPFRGELVNGLSVGRSITIKAETNQNAQR